MLSDKQIARLDYIIENSKDAGDTMSQWHQEFLADIIAKYERFGERLNLSTKQWDVLENILDFAKHV